MLGVVLWSDNGDGKAVIWCEDHSELAYFDHEADGNGALTDFKPGDLVQFDLTVTHQMRRARNPRLLAQAQFPEIAESLNGGGAKADDDAGSRQHADPAHEVLSFPGAPAIA